MNDLKFSQDGAFEAAQNASPIAPDRGEEAEILRIVAAMQEIGIHQFRRIILEETEGGGAEAQIQALARHKALSIVREILARVIDPPPGSNQFREAVVVAYAIGFPGLPSMAEMGRKLGIGKAAISAPAVALTDHLDLPPSCYMRPKAHRETYRKSNQRRKKDTPPTA